MTHRIDDGSTKQVAFVIRPPGGDRFTEQAAASLIGRQTKVRRIDGSVADSTIVDALFGFDDGSVTVTVDVPGGIDRAPQAEEDVA